MAGVGAGVAAGTGFTGLSPLLPLWKAFRNIAYMLFAIAFVLLIIYIFIIFLIISIWHFVIEGLISLPLHLVKLVFCLVVDSIISKRFLVISNAIDL